ncbi:MAG: hypothetical protein AAGK78_09055, partial [Planctomycetota bacterium]
FDWWIDEDGLEQSNPELWRKRRSDIVDAESKAIELIAVADAKIRPQVESVHANFDAWTDALPARDTEYPVDWEHGLREIAIFLGVACDVYAERGDADAVALCVVRLFGIADAITANEPTMIAHLLAGGMRSIAYASLMRYPHLVVQASPILQEEIERRLRDEGSLRASLQAGLIHEASTQQYMLSGALRGQLEDPWTGKIETIWWLPALSYGRPQTLRESVEVGEFMLTLLQIVELPRKTDALAAIPRPEWLGADQGVPSALVGDPTLSIRSYFELLARQRLALLGLLLAKHEREHGAWPASLDALSISPGTLVDPLAADGNFRYDADAKRLWSVGSDGVDDGDDATKHDAGEWRHRRRDLVVPEPAP